MQIGLASKNGAAWWLACVLVAAAYLASSPSAWQCEGVDEIEYLGLAHSLARGQGYTLEGSPYAYYPPLYPVMLSGAVFRGRDAHWAAGYRLNALFGVAAVILAGTWLRRMRGEAGRWSAWLLLFSYYAWSFSTRYLMSEPLYTLLATVALLAAAQALEHERVGGRACCAVAVLALLAATARFGAVALTAAVAGAAAVKALRGRSRSSWCMALMVAVLAGGFAVFWEARAQVVAPSASESYLRWAWKALGLSRETSGMIAQSIGEGVSRATPWPERLWMAALRMGQYLSSAVRVPPGFAPLAFAVALLAGAGVWRELRARPWSPLAWYVVLSFLMASSTSWVSSYLRYMYVVGPLLFYFLIEGLRAWHGGMSCGRWVWRMPTMLVGLAGLAMTFAGGGSPLLHAERMYVSVLAVALAGLYVLLILAAAAPAARLATWSSLIGKPGVAGALLVLLAAQAVGLACLRTGMTARNATPQERNLTGLVAVADWVRTNTPEAARPMVVLPRLSTFLSDRFCQPPAYDDGGRLQLARARYVMLSGVLRDIPAFREAEELRLRAALGDAAAAGQLRRVIESGDAAVYEVVERK